MQSVCVLTTVRVGNHLLSGAETAAGVAARLPFVDEDGVAVDPDQVTLWLAAATGTLRTFSYPTEGPTDTGLLVHQETGRFYVDWAPDEPEDGLWTWTLVGAMTGGSSQSDQDVFYVRRPIATDSGGP